MSLPPELIEKLRQTGIRLDREGRFWHEGQEVTHGGFRRALLRWMDRLDDGRPILRLDDDRFAYVDVEDAHLLAVSARWDGDRVLLTLNDGSEEELDYASLRVGEGHALYCAVRKGRWSFWRSRRRIIFRSICGPQTRSLSGCNACGPGCSSFRGGGRVVDVDLHCNVCHDHPLL
jgi:hypothetical protein